MFLFLPPNKFCTVWSQSVCIGITFLRKQLFRYEMSDEWLNWHISMILTTQIKLGSLYLSSWPNWSPVLELWGLYHEWERLTKNIFTWSNATEEGGTGTVRLHNQPWLIKYKSSLKCKLNILLQMPLWLQKSLVNFTHDKTSSWRTIFNNMQFEGPTKGLNECPVCTSFLIHRP